MLHCKECEKFIRMGGEGKHGVCSLPKSYFPVIEDDSCHYLSSKKKTCKDCTHFENDFACMTAEADDDACCGFKDKLDYEFQNILFEWLKRGEYSRDKVEELCMTFEQTEEYAFIQRHNVGDNISHV